MLLTYILLVFAVLTLLPLWGFVRGSGPIKWLCAVLLVGIFILFFYLITKSLDEAPPKAKRIVCMTRIEQIGRAIESYRTEYDGKNPASLQSLTNYLSSPYNYLCPGSRSKTGDLSCVDNWTSYVYRPDAGTNEVLLYCPPKNHRNEGGNILFGDYSGSWFDKDNFEKVLKAGKKEAPTTPRTVQ